MKFVYIYAFITWSFFNQFTWNSENGCVKRLSLVKCRGYLIVLYSFLFFYVQKTNNFSAIFLWFSALYLIFIKLHGTYLYRNFLLLYLLWHIIIMYHAFIFNKRATNHEVVTSFLRATFFIYIWVIVPKSRFFFR